LRFKLVAHLLDLRGLRFEGCFKPRNGGFLSLIYFGSLLDLAVFFEELIEQHRVHGLIAHRVGFALFVPRNQIGIYLFHLFGDKAKLRKGRVGSTAFL